MHENSIKRVGAYLGADIGSNRNRLIKTFKFREKQVANENKSTAYYVFILSDTG
jgi:hypothetical protein